MHQHDHHTVTTIDGVQTFHGPSLTGTSGMLMFRVGFGDESLRHRGVSHLIEHLALHEFDRNRLQFNGITDATTTRVFCRGTAAEVGEFLTLAARSLANLPMERAEIECRVLRAEAAQRSRSAIGVSLWLRYGATNLGLVDAEELFLHQPDPSTISAWSNRYFTRDNAVLVINGSEIPAIDLSALPGGVKMPLPPMLGVSQEFPASTNVQQSAVTVTFMLERRAQHDLVLWCLEETIRDQLRNRSGLSYSVGTTSIQASGTHVYYSMSADCRPQDAPEVYGHMRKVFEDVIFDGISADLHRSFVEIARRNDADPERAYQAASAAAWRFLHGIPEPDVDAWFHEAESTSIDDVRATLQRILANALWMLPNGVHNRDHRLHPIVAFTPTTLRGQCYPALPDGPRQGQEVHVHPSGVSWLGEDGNGVSIPFAGVVACKLFTDGAVTVFGRDGFTLFFHPEDWSDGHVVTSSIANMVAPDLVVRTSDRARPLGD